jgi:hypothetical protein
MNALAAGGAGNSVHPPKNHIAHTSPSDVLDYALQLKIYNHNPWSHGISLIL